MEKKSRSSDRVVHDMYRVVVTVRWILQELSKGMNDTEFEIAPIRCLLTLHGMHELERPAFLFLRDAISRK